MGLDYSNGSTFNIAKSVFDALGTKTYVVGNEPTVSTSIWNADRCIAVDENGMEVHGGLYPVCLWEVSEGMWPSAE